LLDGNQPFSLKWFLPEIFRQRTAFMDVAIAALFIHLIALVVPLYFQIVIDKVLVNYAISTLQVLTVGICVALVFDAILGYLRSYLLLYATSKIDIRVATRTFGHMLKLPMDFFDHITAGVLTKHMQQTNQIREFLTGNLFLTLLDSTALLIFLPILLFYSVSLTMIVLLFSLMLAINIGVLLGPYRRRLEALIQRRRRASGDAGRDHSRYPDREGAQHGTGTAQGLGPEFGTGRRDEFQGWQDLDHGNHDLQTVGKTVDGDRRLVRSHAGFWQGHMSVGELVAFQMIAGRVTGPLVQLVGLVHSYQQCALSVRMLGTVMNHKAEAGIGYGLCARLLTGIWNLKTLPFSTHQLHPRHWRTFRSTFPLAK
jgi:subfamily B ATP-binding cassette protein HlyB/CyaB